VIHWTGWWKNRISRTLLVFVLTNLGMTLGVWIAGFQIFKSLL
jgi:pheromone shutdown protein TraB